MGHCYDYYGEIWKIRNVGWSICQNSNVKFKFLLFLTQETEAEARELQDFLQAEKSTLAEALKDSESEVKKLESIVLQKEESLRQFEEQTSLLVRRTEQKGQELASARYFFLLSFFDWHRTWYIVE